MDKNIALVMGSLLLTSCVTTPQSREELKETMKRNPGLSIAADYTTQRRFEDVVATLQSKWQECCALEVTTTRTTRSGMTTSRYRDTFHPQARLVNNSLFELTLRMSTQGMVMLNKVPEGGEYSVAVDVVRLPGNKSKVSWYSPAWGWKNQWETHKQWIDGKNTPCPTG